jgi:hypothetical protein
VITRARCEVGAAMHDLLEEGLYGRPWTADLAAIAKDHGMSGVLVTH